MAAAPPPGVRYVNAPHWHSYAFANSACEVLDPFRSHSLSEIVEFALGGDTAGVHSSRLPVGGGIPFLVDVDCLVVVLRYGRPLLCGRGESVVATLDEHAVRRRGKLMVRRYLDDACKGILFRTEHARQVALDYLRSERLVGDRDLARFEEKAEVVRPAIPAGAESRAQRPPAVLYLGRTYNDKGGAIAARVLSTLPPEIRRVWVGPVPQDVAARLTGVEFHDVMSRREWLGLLAEVHIFFAPALFESFGMALAEAAAHGLAIVTTRGPGMEHIEEVFADGRSALLVDNRLPAHAKAAAFAVQVRTLLDRPDRLSALQEGARALVRDGPLSISRRDKALIRRYVLFGEPPRRAVSSGPEPKLTWRTLTSAGVHARFLSYTGGQARRILVR